MNIVRKVLVKSLVKPFYSANAGFFLVGLGLFFGFLKVPQHMDIALALASKPLYYLIPFTFYGAYVLKVRQFCLANRRLESSRFLPYLVLVPRTKRILLVLGIQGMLLVPILGYSVLLAVVAGQNGQWLSATIITGASLSLWVFSAYWLMQLLTSATDSFKASSTRAWTKRLPKTLSTLYLHQLLNRQTTLLLGTKLASVLVLAGFIMIYEMERNDTRLLSLGILLSAGINSVFGFHLQRFEQGNLLFRNLPVSINSWFWRHMLGFLLLALPELIVFLVNTVGQVSLVFVLECCVLLVVLQSFYHALAYLKSQEMEHFIKYPFFGTATLFFVILGHVNIYTLVVILGLLAYLIFRRYYKRFSPTISL